MISFTSNGKQKSNKYFCIEAATTARSLAFLATKPSSPRLGICANAHVSNGPMQKKRRFRENWRKQSAGYRHRVSACTSFLEKAIMFELRRSIKVMVFYTVRCCTTVCKGLSAP
jgi:hypothetical protein